MPYARAAVAIAAISITGLLLAGCSNPIEDLVENTVENAVENVAEEATGGKVDINVDDGKASVDIDGGKIDVNVNGGSVSLPDGFPAELPLPQGTLITSVAGGDSFVLGYEVADAAVGKKLVDDLIAAGLSKESEVNVGAGNMWMLMSSEWSAMVQVTEGSENDKNATLSYTVAPN